MDGYSFLMSNQLIEAELYKSYSVSYHDSVIFQMLVNEKIAQTRLFTNQTSITSEMFDLT